MHALLASEAVELLLTYSSPRPSWGNMLIRESSTIAGASSSVEPTSWPRRTRGCDARQKGQRPKSWTSIATAAWWPPSPCRPLSSNLPRHVAHYKQASHDAALLCSFSWSAPKSTVHLPSMPEITSSPVVTTVPIAGVTVPRSVDKGSRKWERGNHI